MDDYVALGEVARVTGYSPSNLVLLCKLGAHGEGPLALGVEPAAFIRVGARGERMIHKRLLPMLKAKHQAVAREHPHIVKPPKQRGKGKRSK